MTSKTNAKQARSLTTEQKFLFAFNELLSNQSFAATSIQQIADAAGLQKAAFVKRFGTKRKALLGIFENYCDEIIKFIDKEKIIIKNTKNGDISVISSNFEIILRAHLGANRAMHELFLEDYETDRRTKLIFLNATELMLLIQEQIFGKENLNTKKVFTATQLLVTLNYHYCIGGMPAFPQDPADRHALISRLILTALE